MTNACTCKAEHWQPHAESCPEYKPRPLLTVENIRSGAVPSNAVAVGFLLGEIERLQQILACAYQLAGVVGAPVRFLDAFSRFEGDIDSLLPVSLDECDEFKTHTHEPEKQA